MTGCKQLWQDSIEKLKLAGRSPEPIIRDLHWVDGVLDVLNDKRMVANLSKLHDSIVETLDNRCSTEKGRELRQRREVG